MCKSSCSCQLSCVWCGVDTACIGGTRQAPTVPGEATCPAYPAGRPPFMAGDMGSGAEQCLSPIRATESRTLRWPALAVDDCLSRPCRTATSVELDIAGINEPEIFKRPEPQRRRYSKNGCTRTPVSICPVPSCRMYPMIALLVSSMPLTSTPIIYGCSTPVYIMFEVC